MIIKYDVTVQEFGAFWPRDTVLSRISWGPIGFENAIEEPEKRQLSTPESRERICRQLMKWASKMIGQTK